MNEQLKDILSKEVFLEDDFKRLLFIINELQSQSNTKVLAEELYGKIIIMYIDKIKNAELSEEFIIEMNSIFNQHNSLAENILMFNKNVSSNIIESSNANELIKITHPSVSSEYIASYGKYPNLNYSEGLFAISNPKMPIELIKKHMNDSIRVRKAILRNPNVTPDIMACFLEYSCVSGYYVSLNKSLPFELQRIPISEMKEIVSMINNHNNKDEHIQTIISEKYSNLIDQNKSV